MIVLVEWGESLNGVSKVVSDGLYDRASDKVCDHLRRMIVSLELAPGALLIEAQLMEQLGCGRTPLREAFQRLHTENLVVALPRRAVSVADITVSSLQQIYEARWSLEPAICQLAAQRITAEQLAYLEASVNQPRIADETFSVTEWDMAFHQCIAEACGNRYLITAFEQLRGPAQRLVSLAFDRKPYIPPTIDEHRKILEALAARDSRAVATAMDEHIHNAKDRILRTL